MNKLSYSVINLINTIMIWTIHQPIIINILINHTLVNIWKLFLAFLILTNFLLYFLLIMLFDLFCQISIPIVFLVRESLAIFVKFLVFFLILLILEFFQLLSNIRRYRSSFDFIWILNFFNNSHWAFNRPLIISLLKTRI